LHSFPTRRSSDLRLEKCRQFGAGGFIQLPDPNEPRLFGLLAVTLLEFVAQGAQLFFCLRDQQPQTLLLAINFPKFSIERVEARLSFPARLVRGAKRSYFAEQLRSFTLQRSDLG